MCPFLILLRMWRWFLVFLSLCGRHPLFSSERKWLKLALSSGFRVIFIQNALSPTSFILFHSAPHSPTSETLYTVRSFTITSTQTTKSPKKLHCLIYELIWFKQCSKTSIWQENTTLVKHHDVACNRKRTSQIGHVLNWYAPCFKWTHSYILIRMWPLYLAWTCCYGNLKVDDLQLYISLCY